MRYIPYVNLVLIVLDTVLKIGTHAGLRFLWTVPNTVMYGMWAQEGRYVAGFFEFDMGLRMALAVVVTGIVLFIVEKLHDSMLLSFVVSALIAGMGNGLEIVVRGWVVDYIYVGFPDWAFATNLSDILLLGTIGSAMFLLFKKMFEH
jgi:lipoprotein signal peptidase